MGDRNCSVQGCAASFRCKGYCERHYRQLLRRGVVSTSPLPTENAGRRCSADECERAAAVRGWCSLHYQRWMKHGDLHRSGRPSRAPICTVAGCGRPHSARGFCQVHAWRVRATGDLGLDRPIRAARGPLCSVDGCEGKHAGLGYCHKHYLRVRRHGDPRTTLVNVEPRPCTIDACESTAIARGWCELHYCRWRTHGDPLVTLHVHAPKVDANGYLKRRDSTHVLSDARGDLLEHREALFAKIGYGPHRCFWCRRPLTWKVSLQVDHLDADRTNNDPANLEPSCIPCNTVRPRVMAFLRRLQEEGLQHLMGAGP